MKKISIVQIFEFDSAHFLPHHEGLCKQFHGHRYKLEIKITASPEFDRDELNLISAGSETGMITDFGKMKHNIKRWLIDHIDHNILNDVFPNLTPTAESLVNKFWDILVSNLPDSIILEKVRLWETPNSYAEITNESY